jgi:SAM-dependent methyltransferase
MSDTPLPPPRPAPIPPPDRSQIERLNALYDFAAAGPPAGWRSRLSDRVRLFLARILFRQREFNAALVEHVNRNALVGIEAHHASAQTIAWAEAALAHLRDTLRDTIELRMNEMRAHQDELRRHQGALAAWEHRTSQATAAIAATQHELRTSLAVLQQAAQSLKREVARLAESGGAAAAAPGSAPPVPAAGGTPLESLDSHKYVGFEDQFRGSADDIRRRVAEYLPTFQGTRDVLDVGCGRGEFLALLREAGIPARGIDINGAMVDVCRQQGLDAAEADALAYLRQQADGSLGGLFAAQVIEHLEPRYLGALLDTAFDKLAPGAPIVLETINPACWFAFFQSYIRDLTHVRPVHPDTLQYLLVATGFQHVEIRYRSPYPEHEKLQPLAPHPSLGDLVDTLNANAERINRLLFTWLDYAAIGRRP